jgi:diguanylate cyclase (GGDEF)-like protein
MPFDQLSIFAAIGLSSAALALTLFMSWLVGRSDSYLLIWSIGLAVIVAGVLAFVGFGAPFDADLLLASFILLICGFGLIYAGTIQFCSEQTRWKHAVAASAIGLLPTAAAFALGYSGTGTIMANLAIGLLLALTGQQYVSARAETPLLMAANATLYFITAASFVACGYELAWHGQFVLEARPANWAEQVNAYVIIVGLTGIGALSLTIHQIRIANRHRSEARRDPLTGLRNRRGLFDDYSEDAAGDTTVLVMDLDHFKAINDRFGHAAGDRVLRAFAEIMLSNIRPSDIAGRLGGEEFCILANATAAAAAAMAERIRSELEAKPFMTPAGIMQATVSAGIAVRSDEAESLQELFDRADVALYQAKKSGRNRVQISTRQLVDPEPAGTVANSGDLAPRLM